MAHVAVPQLQGRLRRRWNALTLAGQYVAAGSAVLIIGMVVIGLWVTRQIEDGVTRNTATATALYVDSVVAPLLPDLGGQTELTAGARRALDETLSQGALGERLASFKIWREDGLILYSSRPELIGKRFEPTENLKRAWAGEVASEFDELDDAESALERSEGVPLLEIYSPIREPWSGRVVAVAELYEIASELKENLLRARLSSWMIVAAVTLCMMGLLFGIVLRGNNVIANQQDALMLRVAELSELAKQNEELRKRVQRASSKAADLNERLLKRVSADLHDGPAQLLALASLRLGDAHLAVGSSSGELSQIRGHLDQAMQEIRDICRGLALPQIESLELPQLVKGAAEAHAKRTGTHVDVGLAGEASRLTQAEKICVYRFVQEGLNNAFRHAGGVGQQVISDYTDGVLSLTVADTGQGFDAASSGPEALGLAGLRERITSLGGDFAMVTSPAGTRLSMTLRTSGGEIR